MVVSNLHQFVCAVLLDLPCQTSWIIFFAIFAKLVAFVRLFCFASLAKRVYFEFFFLVLTLCLCLTLLAYLGTLTAPSKKRLKPHLYPLSASSLHSFPHGFNRHKYHHVHAVCLRVSNQRDRVRCHALVEGHWSIPQSQMLFKGQMCDLGLSYLLHYIYNVIVHIMIYTKKNTCILVNNIYAQWKKTQSLWYPGTVKKKNQMMRTPHMWPIRTKKYLWSACHSVVFQFKKLHLLH